MLQGGSQSIVSLVNLANGNDVRQVTKQHKLRVEKREDERKESKDEEEEKQGEETDSGEEMEDDNISVNSVQVRSFCESSLLLAHSEKHHIVL